MAGIRDWEIVNRDSGFGIRERELGFLFSAGKALSEPSRAIGG